MCTTNATITTIAINIIKHSNDMAPYNDQTDDGGSSPMDCQDMHHQPRLSQFNPFGKRIGDPSCLQCALRKCMGRDDGAAIRDTLDHSFIHDPESVLLQCTAFFTSPRAESDEQALAWHVKLFTDFMHCISHEGPPERAVLLRLLDCGGRMLMAVKNVYPTTLLQSGCHSKYNQCVQVLTAYRGVDDVTPATGSSMPHVRME